MAISNEFVEKLNGMCPAAKAVELGTQVANAQTDITAAQASIVALQAVDASHFRVTVTVTKEEAVAGKVLLADSAVAAGKKVYVEGLQVVVGGSTVWAGDFTLLALTDTNSSPVAIADILKGGLGANAALVLGASTITTKPALATGGTAAKGLKIKANVADVDEGDTLTVVIWGRIL